MDLRGFGLAFHIGTAPSVSEPRARAQAVVSEDDIIVLRWVSPRLMNGSAKAFLLEVGTRRIPFDTDWSEGGDEEGKYFLIVFDTFGGSAVGEAQAGLKPYVFADAEEKRSAQMLAVEALLVYGQNFDGFHFPDGRWRVAFDGRQWRLSDFGYINEGGSEYV